MDTDYRARSGGGHNPAALVGFACHASDRIVQLVDRLQKWLVYGLSGFALGSEQSEQMPIRIRKACRPHGPVHMMRFVSKCHILLL